MCFFILMEDPGYCNYGILTILTMSLFVSKICGVSVIIISNMDENWLDGQQILWMTLASPSTFRQNNVIIEASLSLVRGLYLISMIHYDVLLLLFTILN